MAPTCCTIAQNNWCSCIFTRRCSDLQTLTLTGDLGAASHRSWMRFTSCGGWVAAHFKPAAEVFIWQVCLPARSFPSSSLITAASLWVAAASWSSRVAYLSISCSWQVLTGQSREGGCGSAEPVWDVQPMQAGALPRYSLWMLWLAGIPEPIMPSLHHTWFLHRQARCLTMPIPTPLKQWLASLA